MIWYSRYCRISIPVCKSNPKACRAVLDKHLLKFAMADALIGNDAKSEMDDYEKEMAGAVFKIMGQSILVISYSQ